MYLFILLSLLLSFSVAAEIHQVFILYSEYLMYLGFIFITASMVMYAFHAFPCRIHYDGFATGSLMVWFPYWYPDFIEGSPVFIYFPLYYAFVTAVTSLIFIINKENVEAETLTLMQWLSDSGRFHPVMIALFVLAGVYFKQHFLLYPVAITLLVSRYALARTLQE